MRSHTTSGLKIDLHDVLKKLDGNLPSFITQPSPTMSQPGLVQRELNKAGAILVEDSKAIGSVTVEAVASGAYIYPLKGVFYLLSNRSIWASVAPLVYKSALLSAAVLAFMFMFTYLPQVAILAFVSGPLAFIAAIPAVFAESYVLITFLTKTFLNPQATATIFDTVLAARGCTALVERGRSVRTSGGGALVLGKSLLRPVSGKFSTEGLIRYLLSLPLNAIPAVGTAFFLLYNGRHAGPAAHSRYFQLLSLSKDAQAEFVRERQGAYTAFGATSLALSIIPVIGAFFAFSNAAGAALWAADMEKAKGAEGNGSEGVVDRKVEIGKGTEEL